MTFAPRAGGIVIRCPDSLLPEDEGNIVYRAAASFFSRIPAPPGIEITIRKKIPIAAGLGGGSSNAATTLMALNEISGSPLTRDEMLEMGAKLGADVPFFIFGNRAWVSGIGDRFTEAAPLPPLWFVLINPGFAVSTKQVYQKLYLELTNGRIKYSIPRFCTVDHLNRGLTNDLEKVVEGNAPFELQHSADGSAGNQKAYRRGILLTHGLTDSPYFMRHLAEFFRQKFAV